MKVNIRKFMIKIEMQKTVKYTEQRICDILQSLISQVVCPITQMPMQNPVITQDGHSYQQGAIYKWLITSNKSPKTGLKLQKTNLTPNHCLKQVIHQLDILKHQILQELYNLILTHIKIIDSQAKKNIQKITIIENQLHQLQQSQHCNQILVSKQFLKQLFVFLSEQKLSHKTYSQMVTLQFPLLKQQIMPSEHLSKQQNENKQKIKPENKSQSSLSSSDLERQVFEKWLKSLSHYFHNHNQHTQNHLLEPYEYLLQKFNSETEEIADRYRKDRYTHDLGLWHHNVPIESMILFVKYDWNVLQFINLCKCQIDDQAWTVLVNHSKKVFSQIKTIWIYGNQIATVRQKDLQVFSRLKQIQFSHYNGLKNPFTLKTRENIKRFKEKQENKGIYVQWVD